MFELVTEEECLAVNDERSRALGVVVTRLSVRCRSRCVGLFFDSLLGCVRGLSAAVGEEVRDLVACVALSRRLV